MAKRKFEMKPKLNDKAKETPKKKELPIQEISVEQIEKIAGKTQESGGGAVETSPPKAKKTTSTSKNKTKKAPQGRPRRTDPVKRLSSDLPADLYDKIKIEVKRNGYTLNGFLAKVLREYFEKK